MRYNNVTDFLLTLIALIVALTFHEFAHGYVSWLQGDPTPKREGRLSLNPVVHLDPLGTVFMVIMLISGVGFAWAKPVMVNPRAYKNWRLGMILTAAAGPAMNLVLATVSVFTLLLLIQSGSKTSWLIQFTTLLYYINSMLMAFNLIPIPPLDGSKVFGLMLPERLAIRFLELERYGFMFLFILFGIMWITGFPVLYYIMKPFTIPATLIAKGMASLMLTPDMYSEFIRLPIFN